MILTPDQRLRVFISSTLKELAEERAAARGAVETLRLTPVMLERRAATHPPRTLYRSYLEQSDIFVGIYGERYGWVGPDMSVSRLEDEYELSGSLPRLIYLREGGTPEPRLQEFLTRIETESGFSYKRFTTPDELAALLQSDLMVLLTERFYEEESDEEVGDRAPAPRLPAQLTAFVGRDRELKELDVWLHSDEMRLVTLIGPGGIGKTRLALEAGERARAGFPDGVFFVSLASLRDPQLVADAVARALDVHSGEMDPMDDLRSFLAERRCLLILDNFEQLLEAAPLVTELLGGSPGLKVVVTSRAALRLRGEHVYDVPPLGLPSSSEAGRLEQSDAVRMFVDRAQAVRPDFELNEATAPTVAEICRQLDGLPLAIELAAVQMRVLPVDRVLERLEARLEVLTGGARDMPERHQRLRDTIEWSYQLLDEDAKELFARLAVFRGGFTLEAGETICGAGLDGLLTLSTLIDHSLVRNQVRAEGEPGFVMLETIREYATERLLARPDHEDLRDRHAHFYSEQAVEAGTVLNSDRQSEFLDRLDSDIDNLRAAFAWLLEKGENDRVAHSLLSTWYFWWSRSHLRDGRRWGERVLEGELSDLGRARGLAFAAAMAFWQSDYEGALPGFIEAASLFEQLNDPEGIALTDVALGIVQGFLGDFEGGKQRIQKALKIYEGLEDAWGVVLAVNGLGWLQATLVEFDPTDEMLVKGLQLARDLRSDADIGLAELNLARFYTEQGRTADSIPLLMDALELTAGLRHYGATSNVIDAIDYVISRNGHWENAVTLAGAADAIRKRIGFENPKAQTDRIEAEMAKAREELGADVVAAHWAAGAALDFADAVKLARTAIRTAADEVRV